MISDIFNIFTNRIFPTVMLWAQRIYDAVGGALPYIIAFFCIGLATRFLIMPIISGKLSAGSDSVRKGKNKKWIHIYSQWY